MKKFFLSFTLCLLAGTLASAAPRYWIGLLDGKWSDRANWSATSRGLGGVSLPGALDSVVIDRNARINVDISPTVKSFRVTAGFTVILYTGVPTTFTVNDSLNIPPPDQANLTMLKDSTSADVPFKFVLNASTNAVARILGQWVFEGGVPVSAGNGPTFSAAEGARVSIVNINPQSGFGTSGSLVYRRNTPDIISSPSTLSFSHSAFFVLDNNPTGAIPDAYWEKGRFVSQFNRYLPSYILVNGNLTGELRHLSSRPSYGSIRAFLNQQTADASLALPHGTLLKGRLELQNTNNHTLTLLASTGPSDSVTVTIGETTNYADDISGGDMVISGISTKVALARATSASAATNYKLLVNGSFGQSGGNFSLQDADDITGSSTLAIRGSMSQTAGTFFTNSRATGPDARFVVQIDPPRFPEQGPGFTNSTISINIGTIDNGNNMVTLRINHPSALEPIGGQVPYQVSITKPLEVGRLDLLSGRVTTTSASVLTVTDPDVATAVKVGSGYVNGPLRRRTNSTNAYVFPTGKVSTAPVRIVVDSCVIIPTSDEPSEYQAEYFLTRYADTQNVQPPLRGVSVDEYWNTSRISGAEAQVRLFVNQRVPRAAADDGLVVARYIRGEWVSAQGSILTPGDTTAGSVVSRTLPDFGPVTFGYYRAESIPQLFVNCPLDISVNAEPNSNTALVSFRAESTENATIVYRIGSTVITSPYNFPKGTTTVDVTATDNTGTATCSFTVKVYDLPAAPRYWIGLLDGKWSDRANWSATSRGLGGVSLPGALDSVVIDRNARINVDISPTVKSFRVTAGFNVILYTGVPTTLTVNDSLNIPPPDQAALTTLKDSTSADVPFKFVLNASTNAVARILGHWVFEGGVPVSAGNGPTFSAAEGARVSFVNISQQSSGVGGGGSGYLVYRRNTPDIVSSPSTLLFGHGAYFVLDNNPTGAIPDAYWEKARFVSQFNTYSPSFILVSGNLTGELRHLSSRPSYGSITARLEQLSADASLALPHGTLLKGRLTVSNTNNHTLTLLASTGPSDNVTVTIGETTNYADDRSGGDILVTGISTKVALARATSASVATNYKLQLNNSFLQSGGNFSLQDADDVTGSSTLAIRGRISQTDGTFFTNSMATGPDARFVVQMDTPAFTEQGLAFTNSFIFMNIGTIDNGRNMVTLRINHPPVFEPIGGQVPYQVTLSRPLEVGRLDLLSGRITTTSANVLTVTDPDVATAVKVGSGYVNGPLRRRTNSTNAYVFPTGKVSTAPVRIVVDSCVIIPASDEPSEYQAEYFPTRYADTQNVQPPLRGVSIDEYWNTSRISGAEAQVRLFVNQRIPGATAGDGLVVARYNGQEWISEQGSVLTPGDETEGSVVSRPLSDLGPFTFGYYPAAVIPPVFVNCPSNIMVNADENSCNALVEFKAESAENATLVYKIGSAVITSPYSFQKGTTTVDVTASDASGTATCSFTAMVNDVQAPVIMGESANPATLSPDDDELKNVFIDYTVSDNCGPVTTSLSVSSNDPQIGNWEVIDEHNVRLQAKKSDADIIYTITITSTDESGNHALKTVTVTVPKTVKDKDKKIKLKVKVMPNPSRTYFTLNVTSNSDKRITMRVIDQLGRTKEVRRFYADATIRLGDNYRPGTYYAIFIQGNAEKTVTLIKVRD